MAGESAGRQMAAVDAQLFWLSSMLPNDQFLVYAFGGPAADVTTAVAQLRRRAQRCPELTLRVADDRRWRYPRWVHGEITGEQFAVHDRGVDWQGCLDSAAGMGLLAPTRMCWRVHVFPEVSGVPGVPVGSVVMVQIAHGLGDGTRSAELAGVLLGRQGSMRPVLAPDRGMLVWRAVSAARAHRRLQRDIERGLIPPPVPPRAGLSVNAGPRRSDSVRTLVIDRDRLPGPTVTVGALVVIADALAGYLANRGERTAGLAAEVPMSSAHGPELIAHNNFRNVTVELHPELDRPQRASRIAAQLADHRRRGEHPAMRASAAAFAAVPAPLLRWGVGRFDPTARSATVNGHTVVSSVNRGPADLRFAGRSVLLTTGFPALSPMMGLTHGVHGIGAAVAIGVHADPTVVDVDDYLGRIGRALTG